MTEDYQGVKQINQIWLMQTDSDSVELLGKFSFLGEVFLKDTQSKKQIVKVKNNCTPSL